MVYDFNNYAPGTRNPPYGTLFTSAARNDEFNLNLGYIEAKLSGDRVRGRFALQTGTSVSANYASGGDANPLVQMIQEAYAGYRIADDLWVDAGIFFSHIGFETWISRDNWNYTRSLSADLSPYYQSGIRVTYKLNPLWSAQLNVLNGWANITSNGQNKALGAQLAYNPSGVFALTYNNFYQPGVTERLFNELILRYSLTDAWQVAVVGDYGVQRHATDTGYSSWYQGTLLTQFRLAPKFALAGRFEDYIDHDGVIIPTGTPDGFAVAGTSLGLDWQLEPTLVWRNEIRALWSINPGDPVFLSSGGLSVRDAFAVSSLAVSF